MKSVRVIIFASVCVLATGCGQGVNFTKDGSLKKAAQNNDDDGVAACEIDIPQVVIGGRVLDFSVDKSGGGSIGFDGLQGVNAKLSFHASSAVLNLSLIAQGFLLHVGEAYGKATPSQTRADVDAMVGYKEWSGHGFYEGNTPISTVTENGANIAVKDLKANLDTALNWPVDPKYSPNDSWIGRVLEVDPDQTVIMTAGLYSNIQVDDEFYVYNTKHHWVGAHCNSEYQGEGREAKPSAVLKVRSIGNLTVTEILSQTAPIKRGAQVKVKTLFPVGTNRLLAKRAYMGVVESKNFLLPGDPPGTFDFKGAINYQILESITTQRAFDIKPN